MADHQESYFSGVQPFAEIKPAPPTIVLCSPDGRSVTIDFGGAEVTYSGDLPVGEAARLFFDAVGGLLKQAYDASWK